MKKENNNSSWLETIKKENKKLIKENELLRQKLIKIIVKNS